MIYRLSPGGEAVHVGQRLDVFITALATAVSAHRMTRAGSARVTWTMASRLASRVISRTDAPVTTSTCQGM